MSRCILSAVAVVVAATFAMTQIANAAVVTQYSFENGLTDTAAGGGTADNLSVFGAGRAESYAAGIVGQAVMIDTGATDAFRLCAVDSADLDLAASFTIEAFVKPDGNNAGQWDRFWTKWGDGGNDWHWAFRYDPKNGLDYFQDGAQVFDGNTGALNSVASNVWQHVALIGDSGANTITGYIDGVAVVSGIYNVPNAGAGAMNFGNFAGAPEGSQFTGLIDEAMIHNTAVSQSYLDGRAALLNPSATPEPSTAVLAVLGAMGLGLFRRRRRS